MIKKKNKRAPAVETSSSSWEKQTLAASVSVSVTSDAAGSINNRCSSNGSKNGRENNQNQSKQVHSKHRNERDMEMSVNVIVMF